MKDFFYIFIGGGFGACARYGLVLLFGSWHSPLLPIATLVANVLGAGLIGLLAVLFGSTPPGAPPSAIWLATAVGFLGGFTTFSTFTLEWVRMVEHGQLVHAVLYAVGSVLSCGLGFLGGIRIARIFLA